MEITGPFLDASKSKLGRPNCWFLRYSAPELKTDGTMVLDASGAPVMRRYRPFYESKAKAEADIPRIQNQHHKTGFSELVMDRGAVEDYEAAKLIAGPVPLVEVAKFWRLHHPTEVKLHVSELLVRFLADVSSRNGEGRHLSDLKSRGQAFVLAGFGNRYPDTITREEILSYLRGMTGKVAPRTIRNHKTMVCEFCNWLVQEAQVIQTNPAACIKKRMLPKDVSKEIEFLSSDFVRRYLAAAERYAPDLVAHEVVQLFAGVRSDDEMANFAADYVLPCTREVVIPAAIAKTKKREVIDGLEDNFWVWWAEYGPAHGLLRPKNYIPRQLRLRILSAVADRTKADVLARMPIKLLLKSAEARALAEPWPWNARRRSFCSHHVAKHQSAAKTALILRHRGSSYTLHNSYRGLGVTQQQGAEYFSILPHPVPEGERVTPVIPAKGIVLRQGPKK